VLAAVFVLSMPLPRFVRIAARRLSEATPIP
jgi:hypothetical protein